MILISDSKKVFISLNFNDISVISKRIRKKKK